MLGLLGFVSFVLGDLAIMKVNLGVDKNVDSSAGLPKDGTLAEASVPAHGGNGKECSHPLLGAVVVL